MPTLKEMLHDYESDQIEIIAEAWGITDDLQGKKNKPGVCAELLNNSDLFQELFETLPANEKKGLIALATSNGKISRGIFEQKYGKLREMGAGLRQKKRPFRDPISCTENLYYKGFLGLAFLETGPSAIEQVYLPVEFLNYLKKSIPSDEPIHPLPQPSTKTSGKIQKENFSILHFTALALSALRGDLPTHEREKLLSESLFRFSRMILKESGLLEEDSLIKDSNKLKDYLSIPGQTLHKELINTWKNSTAINELRMLPDLICEGKWKNDPIAPREWIWGIVLEELAEGWIELEEFIAFVKGTKPNFLRSGGEYESWFIRQSSTGEYLKGEEHWNEIEGAWLKFIIGSVLQWIGVIELSIDKKSGGIIAFRKTKNAHQLFTIESSHPSSTATERITLQKNGNLIAGPGCSREALYQIARFCEWKHQRGGKYHFVINYESLLRAKKQGLHSKNIIALIKTYCKKPIPENILSGISHWEVPTHTVLVENRVLVRFGSKRVLDNILNSKDGTLVDERLSSKDALVREKNIQRLTEKLAENGIFIEILPVI